MVVGDPDQRVQAVAVLDIANDLLALRTDKLQIPLDRIVRRRGDVIPKIAIAHDAILLSPAPVPSTSPIVTTTSASCAASSTSCASRIAAHAARRSPRTSALTPYASLSVKTSTCAT